MNLWLQVFDVCDVSDHDGGDELCDSPQRLPENPEHSHNDRQSPKGETSQWALANPWRSHWINVLVYLPLDYPLTLCPPQILLNVLPRLLRMQMQPWTPNSEYTPEAGNSKTLATERHLVPCRRRSSITLITKAEEYVMKTARSELMFTKLKERNGLMKSVLEKLRKYLNEFACVAVHSSRLVSRLTLRIRLFQSITVDNSSSTPSYLSRGVPQGSALGPLLFFIYKLLVGKIFQNHSLWFYCYADDKQLYLFVKPNDQIGLSTLAKFLDDHIGLLSTVKETKQRSFYSISTVQSFYHLSNHIRSYAKNFYLKRSINKVDSNLVTSWISGLFCTQMMGWREAPPSSSVSAWRRPLQSWRSAWPPANT